MPIRTDWTLDETVMPEDMNDIGKELNRLKDEDKKLENKKLDKTGGTVNGTINATNLQVGGANVYTTSRKPTSSDVGASPIGHSHDDRYFTEAEMNEKLKAKVSVESGKGLSTNDYTTAEKNKLSGIAAGANAYKHPSTHPATMITEDSAHRFVTDSEKSNWGSKAPGDLGIGGTAKRLNNGTRLDSITVGGLYTVSSAPDKPVWCDHSWVYCWHIEHNPANGWTTQLVWSFDDPSKMYIRTKSDKGGSIGLTWNDWKPIGDISSRFFGFDNGCNKVIKSGSILNSSLPIGFYSADSSKVTDLPSEGWWMVIVMNYVYNEDSDRANYQGNNNRCLIAFKYGTTKMHVNSKIADGNQWSGWTKMYSSADKPTPAEIGALGATAKAVSAKTADAVAWANVTGRPSTFAPSSHTHSKAQITDMPTALKNPTAVKVQLNSGTTEGTNQFTYDGSAAKTINVTPANIGALASGGTAANSSKLNNKPESSAGTANTIVSRDSAGDIVARLLRTTYADQSTMSGAIAFRTNNSTDNYTRYCNSPSAVRNWLGALATTGGTVDGTINATNLQVGGANVYTTSRKPTPADIGAIPESNRELKFFGNVKSGTVVFDKTKLKNGVKVSFLTSNKMGTDKWYYSINGKAVSSWTMYQEAKYCFDFTKIKPDGSVWMYETIVANPYRDTIGSRRYDGGAYLHIGELNSIMVYLDHATNVCDNLTALIEYY